MRHRRVRVRMFLLRWGSVRCNRARLSGERSMVDAGARLVRVGPACCASARVRPSTVVVARITIALIAALHGSASLAAVDCNALQSVGYRVLALEDGRKVAVWYPAAERE